jgi:hypothetical protein
MRLGVAWVLAVASFCVAVPAAVLSLVSRWFDGRPMASVVKWLNS